jgi:hypothetical protein
MAELLCRNIEVNNCSASVKVFRFAAGHVDGVEVSLEDLINDGPNAGQAYHYEEARSFNYGGLQLGLGAQRVVMRTLDSFAFADVVPLKVDAEGAEPLVLWGAPRSHPTLPPTDPLRTQREAHHPINAIDDRDL